MPFPGGTQGAHDDTQHQGSAKRDTTNGVAGIDGSGYVEAPAAYLSLTRSVGNYLGILDRTSGDVANRFLRIGSADFQGFIKEANVDQRIQTASMKNIASGIAGLDASALVAVANLPVNIASGILGLDSHQKISQISDLINIFPFAFLCDLGFARMAWNDISVVQGTWANVNTTSQTDWDDKLGLGQPGYTANTGVADNDEVITAPDIRRPAGTYEVKISTVKTSDAGILEVLWYDAVGGNVSLGTADLYAAAPAYNNVVTMSFSPAVRAMGHFRIKCTTKNGASSGYKINISRVQFRKTA
jgi:hypothetical protein